jgi:hypothetical protein
MVTLAVSPEAKRLQSLIRHIEGVQQDCQILGTRLIERGEAEDGRMLIANGFIHDHSKFEGVEWEHLHSKSDPMFAEAWQHHVTHNQHHPEFWEALPRDARSGSCTGIHKMPRVYLAEMVCDWHSRGSELDGGSLRWWIDTYALKKFNFTWDDEVGRQVRDFVELLLEHWN